MIKEINTFEEISGEVSPLFPRIFSAYKYKTGSDNVWKQTDETNVITALLSSVDGNFTLITTENTDFEEIKEFLNFFGCSSILSDVPFVLAENSYTLFKFREKECSENNSNFLYLDGASSLKKYEEFYSLIFENKQNDFESWYCDFSKKIVNNDAKTVALKHGDVLVSVATAPMICKNTAIISGVYTSECFRNNGYSKTTVYKLIDELKKDGVTDIYLWCEKDVEEFYEKIGFEINGKVYLGVIK